MSRRFRVLVNPVSGGGSAPAAVAAVAPLLQQAGAAVAVERVETAERTRASVRRAVAAGELVVAAGGDGMLASVAGTLVEVGGTLGVVPCGRGNDFARMLGLPGDPAGVARCLLEGSPTPVDAIEVTGPDTQAVVLGSLYAGVDSLASEIVDRSRRLPRALQYPSAAVRALAAYRPRSFVVTVDGVAAGHQEAFTVVVANSGYYGSGMHIAPMADVHDGLLDVVVLPAGSRASMIRRLPRVYDGSHVELPGVAVLRGRQVEVAADGVVGYGDGERVGALPLTARALPGAITVLLPPRVVQSRPRALAGPHGPRG